MPLTKRKLDALTYDPAGPKTQVHYDGADVPGFGVLVTVTGVRTFILKYRPNGSSIPKRLTIGRYGALTLAQAREIARDELHAARKGDDPAERKRTARLDEKRSITVEGFAPIYLENARTRGNPGKKRRPKKTWREDERRIHKYVIPALGKRRMAEVTKADVRKLHNRIEAKYESNRVLALVSVMFEAARMLGYIEDEATNPARGVATFEEKSRDRFVTETEMPRLMAAIDEEDNPHLRAAFMLYLLTGFRRGELLGLRWPDVDLDRRLITLPDTKAGRPHHLPLSDPAVAILQGLPRMVGNPYVLPSPVLPGKPMHGHSVKQVWARIRKRAGLPDVRLHDLRRTVGSWLALSGVSLPMIGAVLNHTQPSTTAVYARLQDEATRGALEAHGAKIAALASGGRNA
jgi:integrase